MPYQPDPTLVRQIAARIIASEIEDIRDLGMVDVREMCEDEVADVAEQADSDDDLEAAEDVLIAAVRDDIKAATIAVSWPDALAAADV